MDLPVEQSLKFEFDVPRRDWLFRVGWDNAEAALQSGEFGQPIDCPLEHEFLDGIYIRKIFMPAGAKVISRVHKTRHKYVVKKGRVEVFIDGFGVEMIVGPYDGVTEPGTQRLLYVHEDTEWITFHANPTNTEDLMEIEKRIIEDRYNPILGMNHSEFAHHYHHTQHALLHHE